MRSGLICLNSLAMYADMAYIMLISMRKRNMARSTIIKRDRMHLRIDASTKHKLERAAAYEQTSVTDFVMVNALAAAERVIETHEKVTLAPADWDIFYEALINPPEPNRKLKAAARRYRERFGG
jgi:uncharacterized protein (DUF1778 family)